VGKTKSDEALAFEAAEEIRHIAHDDWDKFCVISTNIRLVIERVIAAARASSTAPARRSESLTDKAREFLNREAEVLKVAEFDAFIVKYPVMIPTCMAAFAQEVLDDRIAAEEKPHEAQ
jgi:hypothetical protein